MNIACFTKLKNILWSINSAADFPPAEKIWRRLSSGIIHMWYLVSMPVPLPAQSSVLWFPSRLYKYYSPGPKSPTVGIEPTETEVSGRKLGMMYFLWDLVKRFRARSKDSAVYFHGAGSRCSTEFLAAWIHSGTARDKMLDCGCQQTCLMRKPIAFTFTSQISIGFEVKSVYYSGWSFSFWQNNGGNTLWQVTWCTVRKLLLILTFCGWPCPSAGWSNIGTVSTRLSASQTYLDYISTLATLTPALPPALRKQLVKWSRV